jgi:hypothetical protein
MDVVDFDRKKEDRDAERPGLHARLLSLDRDFREWTFFMAKRKGGFEGKRYVVKERVYI